MVFGSISVRIGGKPSCYKTYRNLVMTFWIKILPFIHSAKIFSTFLIYQALYKSPLRTNMNKADMLPALMELGN